MVKREYDQYEKENDMKLFKPKTLDERSRKGDKIVFEYDS
jgi:hypothetical protein